MNVDSLSMSPLSLHRWSFDTMLCFEVIIMVIFINESEKKERKKSVFLLDSNVFFVDDSNTGVLFVNLSLGRFPIVMYWRRGSQT